MQRIRPLSYSDNRRVRFIASWLPSTTIDSTALPRRFLLQLLQAAHDLQRVRFPVGDVAELHQGRLAAGPPVARIDQAGRPGDREPGLIVAVEVADGDDALRRRGGERCGQQRRKEERNQPANCRNKANGSPRSTARYCRIDGAERQCR